MQGAATGETIRLEVERLHELRRRIRARSAVHSISGFSWHIEAQLCAAMPWALPRNQGPTDIDVYVNCSSASTGWGCDADVNYTIQSLTSGEELDRVKTSQSFPTEDDSLPNHVWEDVLNRTHSPFLREGDRVVIEATVTVKKVVDRRDVSTVPREISFTDFTTPQPDITDVALVIGDKRLNVSKQLLAVHSHVFRAMFFDDFMEKDKKEIPLGDINFDEFLEFLHVIYPSRKPVTAATIDCLLSLGDRFHSEFVLRECEAFLCGPAGAKLTLEKRLLYVDRFGLSSRVQVHFLDSIRTLAQGRAMRETREFGEFSNKMKMALLDKICTLG